MQYRRLGRSGLQVSALALGSWTTYGRQVGGETAEACIVAAYEAGINLFDTAEGYADGMAEEILGRAFKKHGWRRDHLVIATKVFNGGEFPNQRGLSRKHVIEGANACLRRLQVDYIDILFCHRPDLDTPVEETVRAMDALIRQGKVFYWGTSCWPAARIEEAYAVSREMHLTPPTCEQPVYNLFQRHAVERELAPLHERRGLGLTCYSPLFGGILTGKYLEGAVPEGSRATYRGGRWLDARLKGKGGNPRAAAVARFCRVADDLGIPPARLALAWCLNNRAVSSVITGASRPEQVTDNVAALKLLDSLDDEVIGRIEAAFSGVPDVPASL